MLSSTAEKAEVSFDEIPYSMVGGRVDLTDVIGGAFPLLR